MSRVRGGGGDGFQIGDRRALAGGKNGGLEVWTSGRTSLVGGGGEGEIRGAGSEAGRDDVPYLRPSTRRNY